MKFRQEPARQIIVSGDFHLDDENPDWEEDGRNFLEFRSIIDRAIRQMADLWLMGDTLDRRMVNEFRVFQQQPEVCKGIEAQLQRYCEKVKRQIVIFLGNHDPDPAILDQCFPNIAFNHAGIATVDKRCGEHNGILAMHSHNITSGMRRKLAACLEQEDKRKEAILRILSDADVLQEALSSISNTKLPLIFDKLHSIGLGTLAERLGFGAFAWKDAIEQRRHERLAQAGKLKGMTKKGSHADTLARIAFHLDCGIAVRGHLHNPKIVQRWLGNNSKDPSVNILDTGGWLPSNSQHHCGEITDDSLTLFGVDHRGQFTKKQSVPWRR